MKGLKEYINESQINESENPIKDKYPNVKELGIGEFNGALWGHCFAYEGKKYYSENGWKGIYPSYCKMEINEECAWPHQVDIYQRPKLKKLFDDAK